MRECMGQGGLAHAGYVFDQQVTASQQAGQRQAQRVGLAEDDAIEGCQGGGEGGVLLSFHAATIYRRLGQNG